MFSSFRLSKNTLRYRCVDLGYNRNVTLYQSTEIGSSSLLMNVGDGGGIVHIHRNQENFYVCAQAELSLKLKFLKIICKLTHIILYSVYIIREH